LKATQIASMALKVKQTPSGEKKKRRSSIKSSCVQHRKGTFEVLNFDFANSPAPLAALGEQREAQLAKEAGKGVNKEKRQTNKRMKQDLAALKETRLEALGLEFPGQDLAKYVRGLAKHLNGTTDLAWAIDNLQKKGLKWRGEDNEEDSDDSGEEEEEEVEDEDSESSEEEEEEEF
jgi:hypothetical protein